MRSRWTWPVAWVVAVGLLASSPWVHAWPRYTALSLPEIPLEPGSAVRAYTPRLTDSTALQGPFPDADDPPPYDPVKRFLGALPMLTLYAGVTTWAYFAWYHNQPPNARISINPNIKEGFGGHTYAGGADKVGHFYANYAFARLGSEILMARGWPRHWAVLMNVGFTLVLYTMIEIRDGLHPSYGFSIPDYAANVLGAGVAALLLMVPALDRLFDVRMRYVPSKLYLRQLRQEGDIDVSEDYSAQTVVLAFHLAGIPGVRRTPALAPLRYLDLLVGFNTQGFLPRPALSVMREQELFFGVSLNLAELLRDAYPRRHPLGWASRGLTGLTEYVQLTPIHKTAGAVWRTPHKYSGRKY